MEIRDLAPVVLYDDMCYLCVMFARLVDALSRGRLLLVGHYSPLGGQIRRSVLESDALEMFWVIDRGVASGGRAALAPLLRAMLSGRAAQNRGINAADCDAGCRTARAVFARSASLLTHSRRIAIP